MVVSPDVGGVVRARSLAKRLDNAPLAIVDKRRERAGESEVMNIIGDVEGHCCILVDDIVDSAGTLCNAAAALKEQGATEVIAYCSHGVLSGAAVARVAASVLTELVVTDTIYGEGLKESARFRRLTTAPLPGRGDPPHRRRNISLKPVHWARPMCTTDCTRALMRSASCCNQGLQLPLPEGIYPPACGHRITDPAPIVWMGERRAGNAGPPLELAGPARQAGVRPPLGRTQLLQPLPGDRRRLLRVHRPGRSQSEAQE
jgi:hypothetical protein